MLSGIQTESGSTAGRYGLARRWAVEFQSLREGATLLELVVVIAIIALLAALLLPVVNKAQMRSRQTSCLNQLKQIGLASHGFAHDHGSAFPAQVSMRQGGTRERYYDGVWLADEFYVAPVHLQVFSNDLVTPKIVKCPSDQDRSVASRFDQLNDRTVSYFVGLKAKFGDSSSIMAGDRNLRALGQPSATSSSKWHWDQKIHQFQGNLLFGDGHAESMVNAQLVKALAQNRTVDQFPAVTGVTPPAGSPAIPSSSGPRLNTASYAQSELEQFFNPDNQKNRMANHGGTGITTEPFVYIVKDDPPRKLATVAPMLVSTNRGTSGEPLAQTQLASTSNTFNQSLGTQRVDAVIETEVESSERTPVMAEVHPPGRWKWAGLVFGLLMAGMMVWWMRRSRGPRIDSPSSETKE